MQKKFLDNFEKFSECCKEPMTDLTQLNLNTINNLSKNTGNYDELLQAEKLDDILWAQMKIANAAQLDAVTYIKKASDICNKAIDDTNEIIKDILKD